MTWLIVIGPDHRLADRALGPAAPQTLGIIAALVVVSSSLFLLRCRRDCNRTQEIIAAGAAGGWRRSSASRCSPPAFTVLLVIVAGQLGNIRSASRSSSASRKLIVLALIIRGADGPAFIHRLRVLRLLPLRRSSRCTSRIREMRGAQQLAEANAELQHDHGAARDQQPHLGAPPHRARSPRSPRPSPHRAEPQSGSPRPPGRRRGEEQIEKSKSIAKHLLADVRDVVSRLRNDEPVDLSAALESLRGVIVSPSLHLDFPRELAVDRRATSPQVALRTRAGNRHQRGAPLRRAQSLAHPRIGRSRARRSTRATTASAPTTSASATACSASASACSRRAARSK